MKKWLIVLILASGCATAPPALTPTSRAAWQATRVVKGLDLLRDTAVDAEKEGLMPVETARKVVLWHQASLRVIQVAGTGWKDAVRNSLDELVRSLSPADQQRLTVYVTLIRGLLNEVTASTACEMWKPCFTTAGVTTSNRVKWGDLSGLVGTETQGLVGKIVVGGVR